MGVRRDRWEGGPLGSDTSAQRIGVTRVETLVVLGKPKPMTEVVGKEPLRAHRIPVVPTSLAQVSKAYGEILTTVRARVLAGVIEGVSVQPMAKTGIDVVVGFAHDRTFGPVVMFGLGGIFVEVLNDVAFRVVPLHPRDARAMIREVCDFPTLQGFRGAPPVDLGALEDILSKLSSLAEQRSELHDIDLNPVFAYPAGALAVDARILLA